MRIFSSKSNSDLREAGRLLAAGEVLAIPTETVYGIGADASNPEAIARIYEIKGRAESKALPILVAGEDDAAKLCVIPPLARDLMKKWWPGPLTLVMEAHAGGTLACRCPKNDAALAVLRYAGKPLSLTSANISGQPAPKSAAEISLPGLAGIVDDGACEFGRASAILDVTKDPPELLRYNAPVIGITGGSGAGKSVVAEEFSRLGGAVIKADEIYHNLLLTNTEMLTKLQAKFPDAFAKNGVFDRKAMRAIVLCDSSVLAELNQITHPYVQAEIRRKAANILLRGNSDPIVIEAIYLLGSAVESLCSAKIAVLSDLEKRIARIIARDGLTREEAVGRIKNQKDDEYYKANCDKILLNDNTPAELAEGAKIVWQELVKI